MFPSPSSSSCWLGCQCGEGIGMAILDPELGTSHGGWQSWPISLASLSLDCGLKGNYTSTCLNALYF